MISGFVILMSIKKSSSAADFVVWRFSRLFPAYWIAIALTGTIAVMAPLPGQMIKSIEIIVNITMFQSFFNIESVDGVYWTLGAEISFYFIILAIFLAGFLKKIERCAWVWLIFAFLAHVVAEFFWVPWRLFQLFALDYAQWFVLGIAFYIAYENGYTRQRLALILSCVIVEAFTDSVIMTATMIIFICTFHFSIRGHMRWLLLSPLLWLGAVSYPLYLTHQMIGLQNHAKFNRPRVSVVCRDRCGVSLRFTASFGYHRPGRAPGPANDT